MKPQDDMTNGEWMHNGPLNKFIVLRRPGCLDEAVRCPAARAIDGPNARQGRCRTHESTHRASESSKASHLPAGCRIDVLSRGAERPDHPGANPPAAEQLPL